MISLSRELKKNNYFKLKLPNLIKYLDLVALATICDLVKLDQVNRAFVKQGIKVINQTKNIGLNALIQESSINQYLNPIIDHLQPVTFLGKFMGGSGGEAPREKNCNLNQ